MRVLDEFRPDPAARWHGCMLQVKDTLRATVHFSFDGRVFKAYHGPDAREALRQRGARAASSGGARLRLRAPPARSRRENSRIITTNCGTRVEHLDAERARELFAELETFGVRHDDPDLRNVTYRQSDGRFCVVDFEFATILPGFE